MRSTLRLLLLSIFIISTALSITIPLHAQVDPEDQQPVDDAHVRRYIEAKEAMVDIPLKERVEKWEQFLRDYPDTPFKEDIKQDIADTLAIVRTQEQANIAEDIKDKEAYENFKEEIADLPLEEKIANYERFLNANEKSAVRDAIIDDLNTLKAQQGFKPDDMKLVPDKKDQPGKISGLVTETRPKDPNHALFLASVPGIIVPGIGTFYAGDTATGTILVIIRLAGFGMAGAGIYKKSNGLLITGAIAAGFTWVIDMIAAPLLSQEYNENLEKAESASLRPFITVADNKPYLGLNLTF